MKILLALSLAVASFASYASDDIPTSKWTLETVMEGRSWAPAGYIYHTAAIGTQCCGGFAHHDKVVTELRLICSARGKSNPIIAVFWNGQDVNVDLKEVSVKVDRKVIGNVVQWIQEGPLTYRSYTESQPLIDAMKNGHMIEFAWEAEGSYVITKHTIFSLTGFSENLGDFLTNCKI